MRLLTALLILLTMALSGAPALAQDSEAEDRSYFLGFVEEQLSTPDRQIRISGIEGVLSSNAAIGSITVSDREGVWLAITNARIVWSRSALLLGRLDIETLAADRIDVFRQPLPAEGVSPEAEPFSLPELPLSITLDRLDVPRVSFGPTVFGLESVLAINGRLSLVEGALDTALDITRLDGPGGALRLAVTFSNATEILSVDLNLSEPDNGLVANLLDIEGRPPIVLTLAGTGPLSRFDLTLALDAAGVRAVSGAAQVRREAAAYGFTVNVEGDVARLIAARFRPFFGEQVTLAAEGSAPDAGGFALERLTLDGRALDVDLAAETAADGFLRRLALDARLGAGNEEATVLPVPGGRTTVRSAVLRLSFGEAGSSEWSGRIEANDLVTPTFFADSIGVTLGGLAENLNDPPNRRISFSAQGGVLGITADRPEITEALGRSVTLNVDGDWRAGQPIALTRAELSAEVLSLALQGIIAESTFRGPITVDASSIAPFSALVGRDLAGRLALRADGSVAFLTGGFDLALDGSATGLELDTPALDRLLASETRVTGRVARGEEGLRAEDLTLANPQLRLTADGTFATGAADFDLDLDLADLALLSERASGRLTVTGRAAGQNDAIGLTLNANVAEGTLAGRRLTDAAVSFAGTLGGADIEGRLTGDAALAGQPVSLGATLATRDGERRLSDLDFRAGGTVVTGGLTQNAAGLFSGDLSLNSSDISTAAALALVDATGSAIAEVALSPVEGRQDVAIKASLSQIRAEAVRIGRAEIEATVKDLFGVPIVDGTVTGADVLAGGVDIASLEARAAATGDRTEFSADARLANGTDIAAAGALEPQGQGFRLTLNDVSLAQGSLAARLVEPASVTVDGADVTIPGLVLDVGGGRVEASGTVAENLDLSVALDAVPLDIANAVRPDLGLSGTVSGSAQVGGTRGAPEIRFDIAAPALRATALSRAGIGSLDVAARGTTADNRLDVDASLSSLEGLRAAVRGAVPLGDGELALDVALEAFPLRIANAIVPGQDLAGTLSGTARLTGTLDDPQARFDLNGTGLSAAPLARAGVPPLSAALAGSFAENVLTLSAASIEGAGGLRATASGAVPLRGGAIDLDLSLQSFPLGIANAFAPGQDLAGAITGTARVGGTLASPEAAFDLRGAGLTAGPLIRARVPPLALAASGRLADNVLTLAAASLEGGGGLGVSASGTVPLTGGAIDLDVRLAALPLAILNGFAPNQQLAGTITGTAQVGGTLAAPQADFSLRGAGLSAAALARAGVAPLSLTAAGRFSDNAVTLESASAEGAGGLALSARGRLPIRGTGADLSLNGSVPLAVANRFLAERGAQASGTLSVSATLTGSLAQPDLRGMFSTQGASLVDPQTNVRLSGISIMGTLDGDRVTIRSAGASVGGGGTIAANGSIGISGDLPADISVTLSGARYADGNLLVATLSGSLRLSGPILRDPLLAGAIDVERAEISVPSSFGRGAAAIDVRHIDPPPGVRATLERARADDGTPTPTSRPSVIRLDVQLNAPARIFVRGRGLDAELGGSVRLTGPVTAIEPVGAFRLIRGRLDILGQRITFDEGTVTLVGDLDPFLDFSASTESEGIVATVALRGRVSDLDISFSSQPPLPEDEVLARIIFGRSINELSPLQIAQLAAAAGELAGGENTSLLGSLRQATGLDDLDIVTDAEGNAAVRAGRYIQENVYLGVEAGAGGGARATINLDVTEDLKVRGAVGTDSSLGVFYERDY